MNKSTKGLVILVVTLFATYLLCYGIFFERYVTLFETFFSGAITGVPANDLHDAAFIGTSYIFYWMYIFFKGLPWFDIQEIVTASAIFFLYCYRVIRLCTKQDFHQWISIPISGTVATLCYMNLVSVNNCREILIGIPLILLSIWEWQPGNKKSYFWYALYMLGFIYLILIRFEMAVIAVSTFIGFILFNYQQFKKLWRYFMMPLVFFVMVACYLVYDKYYTNNFIKEIDLSTYFISNANSFFALDEFQSPRDSMRVLAARNFWLADTANMSAEFYKSLQKYKVELSSTYLKQYLPAYFSNAIELFWHFVVNNIWYVGLVCFLMFYLLARSYYQYRNIKAEWLSITGPVVVSTGILFGLCLLIKMEYTVFQPVCLVTVLYLLMNLPSTKAYYRRSFGLPFLAGTGIIVLWLGANVGLLLFYLKRSYILNQNQQIINITKASAKGKYLVLDQSSNNAAFDHKPFNSNSYSNVKKIVLYDNAQLIFIEPFLSYHQKLCSCNVFNNKDFYNFLFSNRDSTVFLSCDFRMNFTLSYIRIVHNLPYWYEEVPGNEGLARIVRENEPDLRLYRLVYKPL